MVSAQKGRVDEILSSIPVRIPDYDNAAQRGPIAAQAERPPAERLQEEIHFEKQGEERGSGRLPDANRLPADIEPTEQERGRASADRLPEELPKAPREERSSGRRPDAERLPDDISQKASGQKKGFDVLDEEIKSAPGTRRAGKKKDDEGDILF